MVEKGGGLFSWVVQAGYKRVGYLDCCECCGSLCELEC
jgi:hypothetical protein